MPWTSLHTQWFSQQPALQTADGKPVEVWEFNHCDDDQILSAWAKHFRNHYCLDTEIDGLKHASESRRDFLTNIKFPCNSTTPGPSVRSGDFGEILVADFLEFLFGYWVPRVRWDAKVARNTSTPGTDVIGFQFAVLDKVSPNDILALFEAKARFSSRKNSSRLQDAIDDSAKDYHIRKAESLNYIKQRFRMQNDGAAVARVDRFQNITGNPYKEISGAVALFDVNHFAQTVESAASSANHPNSSNLRLVIIKGAQMMPLVHDLYRRAADEA